MVLTEDLSRITKPPDVVEHQADDKENWFTFILANERKMSSMRNKNYLNISPEIARQILKWGEKKKQQIRDGKEEPWTIGHITKLEGDAQKALKFWESLETA